MLEIEPSIFGREETIVSRNLQDGILEIVLRVDGPCVATAYCVKETYQAIDGKVVLCSAKQGKVQPAKLIPEALVFDEYEYE